MMSETKKHDCHKAVCQACGWTGKAHKDHDAAVKEGSGHEKENSGHACYLQNAPCDEA